MKVLFSYSGPVTVAAIIPEEGSIADRAVGDTLIVGAAICNPTDLYVRATGEKIALGRAIIELGELLEEQGEGESVTKVEAWVAEADERGQGITIGGTVTPDEFIEIAPALDKIKSLVAVQVN